MATSKIKSDSVDTLAGTKLTGIVTAKGDGSSADGKLTLNCSQNTHGVSIQSPCTYFKCNLYINVTYVNDRQ